MGSTLKCCQNSYNTGYYWVFVMQDWGFLQQMLVFKPNRMEIMVGLEQDRV